MKKIYVLNSAEDANLLFEKFPINSKSDIICSTHGSVIDCLRNKKIECIHLGEFISNEFIKQTFSNVDQIVNKFLQKIDAIISPVISKKLRIIPIDFFNILYRYVVKYDFSGYQVFEHAIQQIITDYQVDEIVVFDSCNKLYLANCNPFRILQKRLNTISQHPVNINIIRNQSSQLINIIHKIIHFSQRGITEPEKVINRLKSITQRPNTFWDDHKQSIILFEPLYELEFLKEDNYLKDYNKIILNSSSFLKSLNLGSKNYKKNYDDALNSLQSLAIDEITTDKQSILYLFAENIFADFKQNLQKYLNIANPLNRFLSNTKIDLLIWGNPPIIPERALINECFRSNGVQILGMQHGAGYADQNCHFLHFDGDFSRCDYYLSYGFTLQDLTTVYPNKKVNCEIIPVGSNKEFQIQAKKNNTPRPQRKRIDILYPISNCLPLFHINRINMAELAKIQFDIIQLLDNIRHLNIVVKPAPDYKLHFFSANTSLKKLNHTRIISTPLQKVIEQFNIGLTILDSASTPLYELIGQDIDIFQMYEPVNPYNPEALKLLQKRIYIYHNIRELEELVKEYCNGTLQKLRDDSFYKKFVFNNQNTPNLILNTITQITLATTFKHSMILPDEGMKDEP